MLMLEALKELRPEGMQCANNLANWYYNNQVCFCDYIFSAGTFPSTITFYGQASDRVCNWQLAFAAMAQFSASKAFDEDLFAYSGEMMINYLKTLQIFDPYNKEHYGAIREMSQHTPWCYVRDALSGAWGFLEYYRLTGEEEYLERAKLWAEWYYKHGCNEDGLPLWGVEFAPPISDGTPEMLNDILGCFHGGSLNFFYQLYKETGDEKYVGEKFVNFANFFLEHCQQEDGFFVSVNNKSGKSVEKDPQDGLHRSNDDFSTLGLLAAYRVTGDRKFLDGIARFLDGCFKQQNEDGSFEKSVAGIPVVLNIMIEAEGLIGPWPESWLDGAYRALEYLLGRSNKGDVVPKLRGAIDEYGDGAVCTRSSAYALIVLTKIFAGEERFLAAVE